MKAQRFILIVDDNQHQLKANAALFEVEGYHVTLADNRVNALELLQSDQEFSLALIDIKLGGVLNGLKLIQEARENRPSLRIIVYTGGETEFGSRALQAGATFFIQKSDPKALVPIADAVAEMWELERTLETHKLKSEEMQRIFDAVGVELLVRDTKGRIILVNQTKRKAWVQRHPDLRSDCIGKFSCPDCLGSRNCPSRHPHQDFHPTSEWKTREHTLILETRPLISDGGELIGTIEAAIDISRRQTILRFEHRIEALFPNGSKFEIAQAITDQLHQFTNGRVRLYLQYGDCLTGYCGTGMGPDVVFEGHRLLQHDAQAEEAFKALYPIVRKLTNKAIDACEPALKTKGATEKLFLPLMRSGSGRHLGMIVIDNKLSPERRFTKEDIDLLALFRSCIETALKNADQRDAAEREKEWLRSLTQVDAKLLETEEFETIQDDVMQTAHDLLEAESTSLFIGMASEKLRETVHLCDKELKNGGTEFAAVDGGPIKWVYHNKELLIVPANLWQDARFSKLIAFNHPSVPRNLDRFQSAVVAPLEIRGVIWSVAVFWFTRPLMLSPRKQSYLKMMLQRISMVKARTDDFRRIERAAVERAKDSSVGFLASAYNHNFRNSVQGLFNRVRLLERKADVKDREAISELVDDIRSISQRIESLRSWVKPNGREAKQIDLVVTLQEIGRLVQDLAANDRISIKLDLPSEAVMVASGGGALKIAILDLFQNGIKFMKKDGKLTAFLRSQAGTARLTIQDQGPGLPREVLRAINEPEAMMVGRSDPPPFGLGLYLALKAIFRVKGTICARNLEEGGAEFAIQMPILIQKGPL